MATAPKSKPVYAASAEAIGRVRGTGTVPRSQTHLRRNAFGGAAVWDTGKGWYKYSHDYEDGLLAPDYLWLSIKRT